MDIHTAKSQHESFKSPGTSHDSFMTISKGLIVMEEMDHVKDYPLLECTTPSEGQALHAANAKQSNVLHFGHKEEGIGRSWIGQEDDYSLLECIVLLQGQALHAVNARQSNVQRNGHSRRGISSGVLDKEAQLSPTVSTRPPQRSTKIARGAMDSMSRRIGLSVVHRSGPKGVADTPQSGKYWGIAAMSKGIAAMMQQR